MKLIIEFENVTLKEQEEIKNLLFMEAYLNKKVSILSRFKDKIKTINLER